MSASSDTSPCPFHWRAGETCGKPFYPTNIAARFGYALLGGTVAVVAPLTNAVRKGAPPEAIWWIYYGTIIVLIAAAIAGTAFAVFEERNNQWRCFLSAFAFPSLIYIIIVGSKALGG